MEFIVSCEYLHCIFVMSGLVFHLKKVFGDIVVRRKLISL